MRNSAIQTVFRFLVAPLQRKAKDSKILISKRNQDFVFREDAKKCGIWPLPVFQKVERKRWSANLHRTRLFISDLQYFAYQESVHGFLLLTNEKTVGT
nr:hypothetical protein PU94_14395 [Coprobacter secundus]